MFDATLGRAVPKYEVLGLPRNPVGVALKDVFTFGIYGKVWIVRINRELDGHERFRINFTKLWILVLLPLITPLIAKWQTLHRMDKALRHQVTVRPPNPKLLWLISLVPILGTVTWVSWTQSLLNRHWLWHKRDERIEAKGVRILELRPYAGDPKVRNRIATLEREVTELETQRDRELAVAESRRRVREEKRAARPKRSLIPVRLGRKSRAEEPAAEEEAPEAAGPAEAEAEPAPRKLLPFLRRKKAPEPSEAAPEGPEELTAAPPPELSDKEKRKLEKQRAKDEAKRAKEEAKAAEARAKEEAKAAKEAEKAAKKAAKKGEAPPAPAPAAAPPVRSPTAPPPAPAPTTTTTATQDQAGAAGTVTKTVKILTLRCPQCQTRIPGVRKVAGEPTPVECPSCHFKATV